MLTVSATCTDMFSVSFPCSTLQWRVLQQTPSFSSVWCNESAFLYQEEVAGAVARECVLQLISIAQIFHMVAVK